MKRLYRPNVGLPTLSGKGATRAAEHVAVLQADPAAKLTLADYWNESDVRGALLAMQGRVCAYCQRRPSDGRGEVDHFRPKRSVSGTTHSGYWWLTYSFENLLIACHDCNHHSKGSKFPLDEEGSRADYSTRASLSRESRLILDPCEDPIEGWMRVDWMSRQEEGFLKPCAILVDGSLEERRTSKTIHLFRLNAELEIRRSRVRALRSAARAHKLGDRETVHQLACRYFSHGSAVHNFIEDVDPSWLPTPKEELLIFLEELKHILKEILEHSKESSDPGSERIINEILWAFAVLWKASPNDTMSPDEIAQWLDEQGHEFKYAVEDKYIKLHDGSSSASECREQQ